MFEHTNAKCHVFTTQYARGKTILNILMSSVICVHFSQLADHSVTWACTSKHYWTSSSTSTLKCWVTWGDTHSGVVDHQCNPAYLSKEAYYACGINTKNIAVLTPTCKLSWEAGSWFEQHGFLSAHWPLGESMHVIKYPHGYCGTKTQFWRMDEASQALMAYVCVLDL